MNDFEINVLFSKEMIEKSIISEDEAAEFRLNSELHEFEDLETGIVCRMYIKPNGQMMFGGFGKN